MTNGNSFSSSVIDFTSHFHLTNNDNPDTILVSHILEGKHYPQWSRAMTTALSAKNKLSFVNDIADSISYETTAQGMWDDLKDSFSQSNAPHLFKLRQDLALFFRSTPLYLLQTASPASFQQYRQSKRSSQAATKCYHCGCVGHTIDTYYVLHGYRPDHRLHQLSKRASSNPTINEKNIIAANSSQSNAQPMVNFAGYSTSSPSSIPLHTWIVDTGALDHMIFDTSLFHSSTHVSHISPLKFPNVFFASVTHIGFIFLTPTFCLHQVLCVPSFGFNLLFSNKLTASYPCSMTVSRDICIFQDLY
ncbi:hypothetical protein AMTRI_Chr09g19620 [Amborella trichopoda]